MQRRLARRSLTDTVVGGLAEAPVVALLGARQVGKTTLAREVVSGWRGPSAV